MDDMKNKRKQMILLFLKLSIAEICFIGIDFLFAWIGSQDVPVSKILTMTKYFEIPSLLMYLLSLLSMFFMNEARLEKFKKSKKKIALIVFILSALLCILLEILWVFCIKEHMNFPCGALICSAFVFLLDYPWLEPKKERDAIDILIEKSRIADTDTESTRHEEKMD